MLDIIQFLRVVFTRVRAKYLKAGFLFRNALSSNKNVLGPNVVFNVPVRCDGNGTVIVRGNVVFGSPLAQKLGNGEILLQARPRGATLEINESVWFSNNVAIIATQRIVLGPNCLVGDSVMIMDSDFHSTDSFKRRTGDAVSAPVIIGKNVWLGSRVIVQKGVSIGDNSIIASAAVVTHNIPPNSIAGGIPAKVIRSLED